MIAAVYLDACFVRLSLGRWPVPIFDGPTGILARLFDCTAALLWAGFLPAVPAAIILTVAGWHDFRKSWHAVLRPVVFAVGFIVLIQLVRYDPGQIWTWFMD